METIGIIGGSGFIGSHVTKKFLQNNFKVKVSSTDISNTEKYKHLKSLPHAEHIEIAALNVENINQLREFVKGCDLLIHGGTPFKLDVQDPEKELLDPTIKGTKNFLEVIKESPHIKRVVFIASVGAVNTNFPLLPDNKKEGDLISENDTPFMSEESHPYAQAKFLAHQTVEKFIADHTDLNFEIVSVSPVGVMGKSLSQRQDSTSTGLQFLFKNKMAPNPHFQMYYDLNIDFAMVDVKDVAEAIYLATQTNGIHGKNYLLSSESYSVSDITLMLNKQPPEGKPKTVYSNELAKSDLGIDFNPAISPLNEYS